MTKTEQECEHLEIEPKLGRSKAAKTVFAAAASAIRQTAESEEPVALDRLRQSLISERNGWPETHSAALRAAISFLCDCAKQGWTVQTDESAVFVHRPEMGTADADREIRRSQLAMRREEQLRAPSTRKFIQRAERPRTYGGRRVSIFSLICDGQLLAERIDGAQSNGFSLSTVIAPYVQTVSPGELCRHTGIPLSEIWRYFRHSWANAYESVPGRTMSFLVRDGAAPDHPIIGIFALGSAAVKMKCRDSAIGWEADRVVQDIRSSPSVRWVRWMRRSIHDSFDETYARDLVRDGLMPSPSIERLDSQCADLLDKEAKRARELHHNHVERRDFAKSAEAGAHDEGFWQERSETPLFRSKRCERLAMLIRLNQTVEHFLSKRRSSKALLEMVESRRGREALSKLVRLGKAESVGTAIADLIVCGAIPPYGEILGGKLVAALAVSPEVVQSYRRKYSNTASLIASSMAGRAIRRPSELCFVGTTTLYGARPNQYDRVSFPALIVGGRESDTIRYRFLERTVGFGTSQFSRATKEALEAYMMSSIGKRWRANNIFGEGANPRMRAMRESLGQLGLPDEKLLAHRQSKCVYGVWLVDNLKEYLLGIERKPSYLFSFRNPAKATRAICDHWLNRWVEPRLLRSDTLERIRKHTLVRPIHHGARVELPEADMGQVGFFDDLVRTSE